MTYQEFMQKNKIAKDYFNNHCTEDNFKANKITIRGGINTKKDTCLIENKKNLIGEVSISKLVSDVSNKTYFLSNPSLLAQWKGFKEENKSIKKENKVDNKKEKANRIIRIENKKFSSDIFELVERKPDIVILKVKELSNLEIARHPYISANMDYISVTRGKKHVLTIIYKSGSTSGWHWGDGSCSIIGENDKLLQKAVVSFIEDICHILLDWDDSEPHKVIIYYNNNLNKWQITLEGFDRVKGSFRAYYWPKYVKNFVETQNAAKEFVNVKGWKQGVAQTGIDIWEAIFK